MELKRETMRKIKELIIFTAILIVCLWKYETVFAFIKFILNLLLPFIIGGAIAFVLNVPMNFFQRHLFPKEKLENNKTLKKLEKPVSLIISLACVIGVIVLVIWFADNPEVMASVNNLQFDWNKIMNMGFSFFQSGAGSVLDSTIAAAKTIVEFFTTFFIAFVFAIYILLQKEKLNVQTRKVLFAFVRKGRAEAILEVCSLTYSTFSSFLTGQCVEAVILGSMFVVVMTLIKLPYALLVGILIAFTAWIPIFGAFIGCGVGAFLIFMVDPMKALMFIVLFLVLQQIEGNFIYPHVVGNSVGLPSMWVLAAVSIGASLMGVVGMLIFIPLVSVVYALFREIVYLKLKQRKINPDDIVKK